MPLPYSFHDQLVLRAPARPFIAQLDATHIRAVLEDEEFMEAVYLASPVLYEECRKWQRGLIPEEARVSRLRQALARYYLRGTSRSTPFGLFAGCALLSWGAGSSIQLSPRLNVRHTRLDMQYLCALAQQLAARDGIKPWLRYWPNTSLYRAGEEFRYVEYVYEGGKRVHQLSAVEASEPLQQLLEAGPQPGQTLPELVRRLLGPETERAAVVGFVEELLAAQVLVSELEPTVTGPEYFEHLGAIINRLAAESADPDARALAQVVGQVRHELRALDGRKLNPVSEYERLEALLTPLGVPAEAGKLLQTDLVLGLAPDQPATLDKALQKTLLEGLEVLTYLSPLPHNPRLADFARRFQARYEEQEVPLLVALDNESGLAYADSNASPYAALVHDLTVEGAAASAAAPRRPPAPVQLLLRQKLRAATSQRHYSVTITKAELLALGLPPGALPLPPSLGVLFRLAGARQVVLEGVGGSSAVNLLGRFAHAAPGIEDLIQQITRHEQARNPGVAFAEICHLPASRIGNLLQRPHFRPLEIPYLAQSTLPPAQQLRVQDLYLRVRDGQLLLRCGRTDQRIIPRLSTAHNFAHAESLPVYQLLCDLQTQGLQPQLGFSWQALAPDNAFWPRLTSGEVILAAATWNFDRASLQELLTATPADLASRFAAFRAQWQLPRYFTLADGDNELLVDADSEWHVRVWLEASRTRSEVQLREFLFDPATSPVRDAAGQPHGHEFLALLLRQAPAYAEEANGRPVPAAPAEPREFSLGSEWLYYKLYCGPLVADRILLEVVRPLTAELQALGLVDTWFFVRYADPDPHLRVRWHLPDPDRLGEILRRVSQALRPYSANQTIWKIQTDTYRRELERYGHRTIGYSEELFGYQSQALLDWMAQAAAAETPPEPWRWALGAVEELLNAFAYPLPRKLTLLAGLRDALGREFGLTSVLKRQLEAKYRLARTTIQQELASAENAALPPRLAAIAQNIREVARQGQLEVPEDRLLGSYVHMLLNRVIAADARLHELVLYDFLVRHYQSALARPKP